MQQPVQMRGDNVTVRSGDSKRSVARNIQIRFYIEVCFKWDKLSFA